MPRALLHGLAVLFVLSSATRLALNIARHSNEGSALAGI
ncbi:hypothetical protein CLU92_5332 [Janthinobacterium sp. 61]|nr:hypothetical protein CLU92_5332 [Janthinobacterium sp. 61]